MNKLNSKGFSAVEALIIFVIIGLIGGVGYFVYARQAANKVSTTDNSGVSDSKSNNKTETQSEKEQKKLDEIKDKVGELNPRTGGSLFYFSTKMTNPDLDVQILVSDKEGFGYLFNASGYANNDDIAPVGSQGPNGSGKSQALQRDKVDQIMKNAGLKLISTEGNEPSITRAYDSELVLCKMSDSMGMAFVICSGKQTLHRIETSIQEAFDALKTQYSEFSNQKYEFANYYVSKDDSVKGAIIGDEFLVNTSGSWKYIASVSHEGKYPEDPPCDVLVKSEYKDVFHDRTKSRCKT